MSNYDPLEEIGRIIAQCDGIPLPPGYNTSLPDNDPINHKAYTNFHNAVGRLIADNQLGPWAKIVMALYLLHGTGAGDQKICKICGLSLHQLHGIQIELMQSDWLASPQG